MNRFPVNITALMLYYGRRNVAEEAIECFLRQTYDYKHLVIVNTHPDPVYFAEDEPQIEVHNMHEDCFENLNAKYNYAFKQISTNFWTPWDSDDIRLPWHMANLAAGAVDAYTTHPIKVGVKTCYFADDNVITRIGWNMWGNCIYESHDRYGNLYPKCDPQNPENCDSQIMLKTKWTRIWVDLPRSLIFRWDQLQHASAFKGQEGLEYHEKCRAKMNARRFDGPMKPHWDKDYVAEAKAFEAKEESHGTVQKKTSNY
jgi:hypothetical protein